MLAAALSSILILAKCVIPADAGRRFADETGQFLWISDAHYDAYYGKKGLHGIKRMLPVAVLQREGNLLSSTMRARTCFHTLTLDVDQPISWS